MLDVAACPASAGLFEVLPERHSHVIIAAGVCPALAFYPISSETRSLGLASIAWAVATRVTSLTVGAIDGVLGMVGLRGRNRRKKKKEKALPDARRPGRHGDAGEGDAGRDDSPPPLVLRWSSGFEDERRRVTDLCLDPSGRLAAAADAFGRVMLVDCSSRQVLTDERSSQTLLESVPRVRLVGPVGDPALQYLPSTCPFPSSSTLPIRWRLAQAPSLCLVSKIDGNREPAQARGRA